MAGNFREGKMVKKILIIDEDQDLGRLITTVLGEEEFHVYHAFSGGEGLRKAYEVRPDLVILDIMMPGLDGFTVCSHLREIANVPILMLTALSSEKDVLRGFTVGVDDYLKKPFTNSELRARVHALLRRYRGNDSPTPSLPIVYTDSVLEIDLSSGVVKLLGNVVELSPKEHELLAFLVSQQGKVSSYPELAREIWGDSYAEARPNISLYIYYLRKKLEDGKHGHKYLYTHRGRGYWFSPRNENNP